MKNRRRERRVRLPSTLDATITYSDAPRKVPGGLIGDISTNGMFMLTEAVLDKDAYVTCGSMPRNISESRCTFRAGRPHG
jgi:hypothetical protein